MGKSLARRGFVLHCNDQTTLAAEATKVTFEYVPNPSGGTEYLTYDNSVSDKIGKNGDLTATSDGRVVAGLGQDLSSTDSSLLVFNAPGGAAGSTVDVIQISKVADDTGAAPGAPLYVAMTNTAGAEVLGITEVVNVM